MNAACKAGRFSNATDLFDEAQCTPAAPGFFSSTGSASQTLCASGTITSTSGQERCELCNPGTSASVGQVVCTPCIRGFYASNHGQGQCTPCPYRLSSPPGAATCSVCDARFYLLNESAEPRELLEAPDQFCVACPFRGVTCGWNTTLATLDLDAGFWRLSPRSVTVSDCAAPLAAERCTGGVRAGDDGEGYCGSAYKGPECLLCRGNNSHVDDGRCVPCPDLGERLPITLGLCALVAALCVSFALVLLQPESPRSRFVRFVRQWSMWLHARLKAIG